MSIIVPSQQVDWWSVHELVTPVLELAGSWPLAGTPAWCALPPGDHIRLAALYDAAQHWALRMETCQLARREAGRDIADAADWPAIARDTKAQADLYIAQPWLKRASAR